MRKRLHLNQHSLVVQMVLSFMALVLLTAAAAGLPAIWLIRNQIERQAWAQVDQGSHATQALYESWQSKVTDMVTLTAQRPTLRRLLLEEQKHLPDYLQTLRQGTTLDLILICDPVGQPVAHAGTAGQEEMCAAAEAADFYTFATAAGPQIWLLAGRAIGNEAGSPGRVVVGLVLDNQFVVHLRDQTALEQALLLGEQPVAASLEGGVAAWNNGIHQPVAVPAAEVVAPAILDLDGRPYYAARFPLGDTQAGTIAAEVTLDVADIAATQRRLIWSLTGGIALVALVGSALGLFLARRIGRPLTQLADAAAVFSTGDLEAPVAVEAQVREVALVAQALESARADLQRTLNELRQTIAWNDHLLDSIVEGIVTLDRHGRINFFSPGAERITGWRREEVLNRSCDHVFQPIDSNVPFSHFIPPPGGQRKMTLALANGRQATLALSGARLSPPAAGEVGVALVFRDVSEADLVHRLLGEFLANVTHEFRTPLSALAASTELLLDQAPDLSPAELRELLTSLHLGIVGLQTLVDNLLESASMEAGRFRVYPRPSDLGEIIAEAAHMMQPLQEKYRQRLLVELPAAIPMVQADPRRVVQVLVNLLSNAIKYSPDETEVTVSATAGRERVKVCVADRGPGVPAGYRPDLFRRFAHPGAVAGKSQYGVGLGLSVVKATVEAHGGLVGVDDRPGGGSVFWFTLPLADETNQQSTINGRF